MNLKSKGARRTLAAACSTALAVAGGAFVAATSAQAAGVTLAYGPTATSATILNLDPGASSTNADATYGLKVTGAAVNDTYKLRLSVLSGPTGGSVSYEDPGGNSGPTNATAGIAVSTTLSSAAAAGAVSLPVVAGGAFTANHWVAIVGASGTTEYSQVNAAGANAITLLSGLVNDHAAGDAVYDLGAVTASTTASADPGVSATVITLTSVASFRVGDLVRIGGDTDAHGEVRQISAINGGAKQITVAAISATDANHANGAAVVDLGLASTAAASAGATTLTVNDATNFTAGHWLWIGGSTPELVKIVSAPAGTTLTVDPLAASHEQGSALVDAGATSVKFAPVPVGTSREAIGYDYATNADNIFLGATVPGTYTLQFFKDKNGNYGYDATQDEATPVFTLTVKDVTGTTASTADDWAPSVTVPPTLSVGQAVPSTITLDGLTTVDTRGVNVATGVNILGEKVAGTIGIQYVQAAAGGKTNLNQTGLHPSFDGTNFTLSSNVTASDNNTAAPVVTTITGVASTSVVKQTTIQDNLVTGVSLTAPTVTGKVATSGTAVAVKTGTSTVAYKATATVSAGDKSGKTIYFTLTPTQNTPTLSADGTLISSNSGVKVYTATTDADGYATLNVTSDKTTAAAPATKYSVIAKSNGQPSSTLVATYQDPAVTTVTANSVYAKVGGSATVTGSVTDQWSQPFTPTDGTQATLSVDRTQAGDWGASDWTHVADIANGTFSTSVPDTTSNTLARTDALKWTVGGVSNASPFAHIYWQTTVTAPTVALTTLNGTNLPFSAAATPVTLATHTATNAVHLVGSIKDAAASALVGVPFTLSASPGVYFASSAGALSKTFDGTTNNSGLISDGTNAYVDVVSTKAGDATLTLTSDGSSTTVAYTVHAALQGEAYDIALPDTTGVSGKNVTVRGVVLDAFGNPVPTAVVTLTLAADSIGAFNTTVTPSTDANGNYTAVFVTSDGEHGDVHVTAQITTPGRAADYAVGPWVNTTTGVTLPLGHYKDTNTITVSAAKAATLTAPASRVGAGSVHLTGETTPGASVEVYSKPAGTAIAFALVGVAKADDNGWWEDTEVISRSTIFYAKSGTSASSPVTVAVLTPKKGSSVKVSAKALGKGSVRVSANGNVNAKSPITVYVNGKAVRTVTSNSAGDVTVNVVTGKGKKTIKVVFAPSGYYAAAATTTVYVK